MGITEFEFGQIGRALKAFASSIDAGDEHGIEMGWTSSTLRDLSHKIGDITPETMRKIITLLNK